jgi:hypothetical protein
LNEGKTRWLLHARHGVYPKRLTQGALMGFGDDVHGADWLYRAGFSAMGAFFDAH